EPGDVGVQVETATGGRLGTAGETAGRTRVVAREAAVVRAALAVHQVELDTEHGLGPADRELEVGAEARTRVPLPIVVAGEHTVIEVATKGRHLVERPGDCHLRRGRGRLRERRRSQQAEGNEGEYCDDQASPHYCLLKCGEQQPASCRDSTPTSPTTAPATSFGGTSRHPM